MGEIPPLKDFDQDVRTFFAMSFRQEVLSSPFYYGDKLQDAMMHSRQKERRVKRLERVETCYRGSLCARQVSVKPLCCICYCLVMFSVHLCVHYILYAKNNKQLVLGYVVAHLDACRKWSYQVENGSCGLYVQKMVYIVLKSKCPSATPPYHKGRTDPDPLQGALQGL